MLPSNGVRGQWSNDYGKQHMSTPLLPPLYKFLQLEGRFFRKTTFGISTWGILGLERG